jgi:hypothetical protein
MATVFDIAQSRRDAEKLTGETRDRRKRTILYIRRAGRRPLVTRRNREAIKIVRAYTRDLRRLLYSYGVSIENVSSSMPALSRCLAQSLTISLKINLAVLLIGVNFLLCAFFAFMFWHGDDLLPMTMVFNGLSIFATPIMLKAWMITNENLRITLKYGSRGHVFFSKHLWIIIFSLTYLQYYLAITSIINTIP